MTAVVSTVLTTLSTIVPATLIFVIGQILARFVLEPIQDQARTVGRVAFCLLAYADLDPRRSKIEHLDEASKTLRELAAQLRASRRVIPFHDLLGHLRCVLSKRTLCEASAALVHWSNAVYNGDTRHYRDHLARILKVPGLDLAPRAPTAPDNDAADDLSDDESDDPNTLAPSLRDRNICTLLAQDAPRPLAA
jgi:hypothetical protein